MYRYIYAHHALVEVLFRMRRHTQKVLIDIHIHLGSDTNTHKHISTYTYLYKYMFIHQFIPRFDRSPLSGAAPHSKIINIYTCISIYTHHHI